MAYYLNPNIQGIISANSTFQGTTITLKWAQAYPQSSSGKIAYTIYMSDDKAPDFTSEFFRQPFAFISTDGYKSAVIEDLTPGILYHFGVRAAEYTGNLPELPIVYDTLHILPRSLLATDVSPTDMVIHLIDSEGFPASGTGKIGTELFTYSSIVGNDLIVSTRGVGEVEAREHLLDGYDGYANEDNSVSYWLGFQEEQNTRVFECMARFDWNEQKYLPTDGYHQKLQDLVNTNMTVSDTISANFPPYDFSGYHRTTPEMILSGACIGSYIGGVQGCVDGYSGSQIIRGVSPIVQNQQRQEVLLNTDGEPMILVQRQWTGVTCTCYIPGQEYPEARCGKCLGGGFIVSWQQFFNPRRSDRKIMVRFDPVVETVDPTDSGLEANSKPNAWTLTVPSIFNRDFLVRYDQNGNEEYRYEVINVTRNKFFLDYTGLQKFTAQKVRKTDIIYQVPVFETDRTNSDGSEGINVYRDISTSIEMSPGFPPHTHTISVSDSIISPSQINTISSVSQGHSHVIRNGIFLDGSEVPGEHGIGHIHQILFSLPS